MEHIRQAVELAKQSQGAGLGPRTGTSAPAPDLTPRPPQFGQQLNLKRAQLEANRIIAHDLSDPRSTSFDILRTQVLQSMDANQWGFLGITSPSPACGKTVVSINLAMSLARHPDRSVLLVELDVQRPRVSNYLGIRPEHGLLSVLKGEKPLQQAVIRAQVGTLSLPVLVVEHAEPNSAELMASRRTAALFEQIEREFRDWIVIFDLPPLLASDDAMWITPHLDCALFVAGAGTTTADEMQQCTWHLDSLPIVRVVLNKAEEPLKPYYSRYGSID